MLAPDKTDYLKGNWLIWRLRCYSRPARVSAFRAFLALWAARAVVRGLRFVDRPESRDEGWAL